MGFSGDSEHGYGAANRRVAYLLLPLTLLLAAVLAVFSVYDTVQVVGGSMLPALEPHDLLLVTHGYGEPSRGDVVSILVTEDGRESRYVKRVLALPGDEVRVRGDVVYVNGSAEAPYEVLTGPSPLDLGPYSVPPGMVFVAGDNRPVSLDSRFFGPLEVSDVQGRAVAVLFPLGRAGPIDGTRAAD